MSSLSTSEADRRYHQYPCSFDQYLRLPLHLSESYDLVDNTMQWKSQTEAQRKICESLAAYFCGVDAISFTDLHIYSASKIQLPVLNKLFPQSHDIRTAHLAIAACKHAFGVNIQHKHVRDDPESHVPISHQSLHAHALLPSNAPIEHSSSRFPTSLQFPIEAHPPLIVIEVTNNECQPRDLI